MYTRAVSINYFSLHTIDLDRHDNRRCAKFGTFGPDSLPVINRCSLQFISMGKLLFLSDGFLIQQFYFIDVDLWIQNGFVL